jgi:hypothetical protein
VLGIQRGNLVVRHDRNREFRFRPTDLSEHANRTRPEQAGIDLGQLSRSRWHRESNRHSSSESVALRTVWCLWASSARLFAETDS